MLQAGQVAQGHSSLQTVQFSEGGAGRQRQFALVYGITVFQGYKNRTRRKNKGKEWWITSLDKVRYDCLAEVKGRFNSCLSSKCSALSAHTGLALKPPPV